MSRKATALHELEEYFDSEFDETLNPFIRKSSRKWGRYAQLTGAGFAALFLLCAYILRSFYPELSHMFLVMTYFLAGTPAVIRSLEDLRTLRINIDILMTLAAFLSVFIGGALEGGLLLVLFTLSEALENTVEMKTKSALLALHKLAPSVAHVVQSDGSVISRSVRDVALDTHILVRAGEIIPLDGVIVEGKSFINTMHLTGESIPIPKREGDEVTAGSTNTDGALTIRITKTSAQSTLSRIIQLIAKAHESKPHFQRFLDRFGETYATSIILVALALGTFLPLLFDIPYLGRTGSVYRALAFLIAASPCALIIATPTAYLSAISSCAKKGVLLKGGVILDALSHCKMILFDKTGTLTTGSLECTKIDQSGPFLTEKEALAIAAGLEQGAIHPIANALVAHARQENITPQTITEQKALSGRGIQGTVSLQEGQYEAFIGSPSFIKEQLPTTEQHRIDDLENTLSRSGVIITILLIKDTLYTFHFQDEPRSNVKETMSTLKELLSVAMITGDHKENAAFMAKEVGIDTIFADLTPEEKLNTISQCAEKEHVVMVGDGINDGPALARATVGIAMGEIGTSTAIDAADVVLLRDDLSVIAWLIGHAKKTSHTVIQNITLALLVIFCVSVPAIFGLIPIWLAVILHEGSTVVVGLNSLRLFSRK